MRYAVAAAALGVVAAIEVAPDVLFTLLFGWLSVLRRTMPLVVVSVAGVATALVALGLAAAVLHLLAARWSRHGQGPWRLRWTVGLTFAVALMFVAGLSGVGLWRSTQWFLLALRSAT